ncbi:MAG: hypothetical protein JJT94_16320 [Bernardetiaceae bacterium]|nr:hypothetical protein [Bernardetiaceae bacterium]
MTQTEKFITALAKIISYAIHPALMPTVSVAMVLVYVDFQRITVAPYAQVLILIFLVTFIVPVILFLLMLRTKLIRSLEMETKEERAIPFLFTTVFYTIIAYFFVSQPLLDFRISLVLSAIALSLCCVALLSLLYKVSVHAVGVGGLLGFLFAFQYLNPMHDLLNPTLFVLFLGGLVGSARLYLRVHSPHQVATGYLLGFTVCFFFCLFSYAFGFLALFL